MLAPDLDAFLTQTRKERRVVMHPVRSDGEVSLRDDLEEVGAFVKELDLGMGLLGPFVSDVLQGEPPRT